MANQNIQMKVRTGTGTWDNLFPKTTTDQVIGLLTAGVIDAALLPALAITDTFEVASEAEMTALVAEKGDVAIRSDVNQSYILAAEPATVLANWKLLRTPTDTVLSVNGRTGAITLTAADVGAAPAVHTHVRADITDLTAATSTVDGLMSAADKTKLDALDTGGSRIVAGSTAPVEMSEGDLFLDYTNA
jgi:hypothetical protein